MARCFPPAPEFGDGRHGERAVWEALRAALPAEVALLYSRWIVEPGREYEIDVLVAWPGVGLAAIEVKGGHVARDEPVDGGAAAGSRPARSRIRWCRHPMRGTRCSAG